MSQRSEPVIQGGTGNAGDRSFTVIQPGTVKARKGRRGRHAVEQRGTTRRPPELGVIVVRMPDGEPGPFGWHEIVLGEVRVLLQYQLTGKEIDDELEQVG